MMKARTIGLVIAGLVALTLASGGTGFALAGGRGSMMGGNGPNSRGYPGMMNGSGPFAGTPMMGEPGSMWGSGANTASGQPLTLDRAQQAVQIALDKLGNRDLVVDEVMEFQQNFYAIIKEKSTGTGALEVLVDKQTGAVLPEYGPNMMWNTKYGMMRGQYDSRSMNVTGDQATQSAAQWLAQNEAGAITETPDTFYGYYTLHILKGGKVTGMLSVNGETGQVWYHNWHGDFIGMKDLNG